MDRPIRHLIDNGLSAAKAAVSTVNPKHLAIPHPPHYDKSSPGSIVLAMMREQANPTDPLSIVKNLSRIRQETKAALRKAMSCIDEAREQADGWMKLIEYLEGARTTTSLGIAHPQLEAAARTIKTAAETGNLEPRDLVALTSQMRRDHAEAMAAIDTGVENWNRIQSAGNIALAVEAAKALYQRANGNEMLRKMAAHHAETARMRKLEHAHKYYDEAARRRTMGGIERRAIGVKLKGV